MTVTTLPRRVRRRVPATVPPPTPRELSPERLGLLAAIRELEDDDTPRLIYADWLEEFGTTDLDAATAEFLRLSCDRRMAHVPIREDARQWLHTNWHRLVPSLAAIHSPPARWRGVGVYPAPAGRWGRTITVRFWLPGLRVSRECYALHLSFSRGFLDCARIRSDHCARQVAPWLAIDQPLFRLHPPRTALPRVVR